MELEFILVQYKKTPSDSRPMTVYLEDDNWDDFGFKTTKRATLFDKNGKKHDLGFVRIGKIDQKHGYTNLPDSRFSALSDQFFSLGYGVEYYKNISKLDSELKNTFLKSIRDVVILDDKEKNNVLKEKVALASLLRDTSRLTIDEQYKRILDGKEALTAFDFKYDIYKDKKETKHTLEFNVKLNSLPPTNIHAIIGRNGVGKTRLFKDMIKNFIGKESLGKFSPRNPSGLFSRICTISYSAFDSYTVEDESLHFHIGSTNNLDSDFCDSIRYCLSSRNDKLKDFKEAVEILSSDPIFEDLDIVQTLQDLFNQDSSKDKIRKFFNDLSSGHSIVLLIITRLIEKIEEKMLVLIDEPENHLHPPLLSAFIGALSRLLIKKNAVAIIATHSPVVAQEIPKSCIYKLYRFGDIIEAERFCLETFGASIGSLTNEVFGLEVEKSGFYAMLDNDVKSGKTYDEIFAQYNNQLGSTAIALLNALIYNRDKNK